MDIKIRCPHCDTKLIVGDDLVGQTVLCEECNKQFTVESLTDTPDKAATAEKPPPRDDDAPRPRRRREDDDDDARPRSRRPRDDFDDDDDDAPIRRKPKRNSNSFAPIIFGSLLTLTTLLVAVGLFFAFGFGGSGRSSLPAGSLFRVSNPSSLPNGGFSVDVETADGNAPPAGRYQVTWMSDDGLSRGNSTLQMFGQPRTVFFAQGIGPRRRSFNIWIEHEPATGTKLSNVVTLR